MAAQSVERPLPPDPLPSSVVDSHCHLDYEGLTERLPEVLANAEAAGVAVSMDSRGRALDNVFVERLWRTVKYENVYLNDYAQPRDLETGLIRYWDFYCHRRKHQALGKRTPAEVYWEGYAAANGARKNFPRQKAKVFTQRERYSATASARDL